MEKELPRCPSCGLNGAELVKMGWIGHWTKKEGVCAKCRAGFPSGAFTIEKDRKTGLRKKVDFLEKLLNL